MKSSRTNFLSLTRDLLRTRFLTAAAACLACVLGTARPLRAQTTYPVNGTAGFDTGLQRLATVDTVLGVKVDWGDGTGSACNRISAFSDTCALEVVNGVTTVDVYGTHRYTAPGAYQIGISYVPFLQLTTTTITTTATISSEGDFVVLSIGDSVASGEGNPPVYESPVGVSPGWGVWDDPVSDYPVSPLPADEQAEWPSQAFPCHRSGLAGPAQAMAVVQQNNPGVTFIHYACSGAKIEAGDTANTATQDAIGQLRVARGRHTRIDVLLITAGANSLYGPNSFGNGFGDLVKYCLNPAHDCDGSAQVSADLTNSFSRFPSKYQDLAKEINCINPAAGNTPEPTCTDPQKQIPKLVLITEYMDPTRDQNGNFPNAGQCPATLFNLVDHAEWMFFYNSVVGPLNSKVDSFPGYATQAGLAVPTYAVTGIADDFNHHGICAGDQRWVEDISDSETLLGRGEPPGNNEIAPPKGPWTDGTGHPNSSALGFKCSPLCGQEDYRDRIYAAVVKYNPPITTPNATTDGRPYVFGTWTTRDVVMTLSATNGIKEAGVGATFYGVDSPQCTPANAAGCKTYSGRFEIDTSGKHTVTFFSQNAQGFPEAPQTVQVWVDNQPPVMSCTATPSVLWPPNNKMVPVNLHVTAVSAAFGPTPFVLRSVETSEGDAAEDIAGFVVDEPSVSGSLRASREGNRKAGRVYTFVYKSVDPLGLIGTCTSHVLVPHDQGKSHR